MSKLITNELSSGSTTINESITVIVQPPSGTSLCPLTGSSGSDAVCTRVTGDTNDRLSILYDGYVDFGDGTNAPDTRIERTGVNTLTISGGTLNLQAVNTSVSNSTTNVVTATNSGAGVNPTYALRSGGQQEFGPGNNPADTFLYRSGASNLTLSTTSLGTPTGTMRMATTYTNSIITNSGDLFISPAGSNINVDSKNVNNVNSALFNAAGLTRIQGTNTGTLSITDNVGALGTLEAAAIETTSGDLSISANTGEINFNLNNLNSTFNIDNDNVIYSSYITLDKQQPTLDVLTAKVPTLSEYSFGLRSDGLLSWGSGSVVVDTYLRRFGAAGRMTIATANNTTTGGELYVDKITSSSALTLTSNSGNVIVKPSTNIVSMRNSGNYDPIEFDLANYAIRMAPDTFGPDLFLNRTSSGTIALGTTLGATNGVVSTQTFRSNGANVGTLAQSCNVSGDSQSRYTLDMDGQLAWSSGSANRDVWLYRNAANTLTLSTSSRGGSSGALRVGSLREVGWAEINNGTANTYNSTTPSQSVLIGQAHDLISPIRALVQGSGNTYYRASSSAIIGSTNSVLTSNSSSQSNHVIAGCTDVLLGTATGTTGNNCVILASNGTTGSCIVGNAASRSLVKGHKVNVNQNDCVFFSDSGSGFGGTTTIGAANIFQCAFQGYYFNSNPLRTVGVEVAPGANSWTAISDARLKDIHGPIPVDVAYAAIDRVNVYNYNWKDDEDKKLQVGCVAQEVNAAFAGFMPKHVSKMHQYTLDHPDEEPIQTVCGDEIAYISLALIKHQKKLIEILQQKNIELENRIIALENGGAKRTRAKKL